MLGSCWQGAQVRIECKGDADSVKLVLGEDEWACSEALTDADLDHLVAHFSHAPGLYFGPSTLHSHAMPLARAPALSFSGAGLQSARNGIGPARQGGSTLNHAR